MSILSKGIGKIPPATLKGAGLGALGGLGMGMMPRMGGPMMGGLVPGLPGVMGGPMMPGMPPMGGLGMIGNMLGGAGIGGLLGHIFGGNQGPTTPTPQIPGDMGRRLQGGAKANNVMPLNTIYDQGGMSSYESSPYPY